ncbi:MAG: sulfatase [Faecalibacterium sp.]
MKQPNILYMMSDDLAANAVSCYGSILSEVFQTPNLDRIAQEGVRMERFYATNSICTPARATIMTGQYGQLNGVRTLLDHWHPEAEGCLNLAQILQDGGYYTSMFGKWHLHCDPVGFDDYKYLNGVGIEPQQGVYQDPTFREKGVEGYVCHKGYVTDIITDMALADLQCRPKDKPFFMMCHHKAPHDFWEFAERHEHLFDGIDIPVVDTLFEDRSHRSEASREYGSSVTPRSKIRNLYNDFRDPDYVTGPLTGTEDMNFEGKGVAAYQKYLKDYLRTVAAVDESVGAILAELEAQGELDNTIVIYTSDQGMFLGEHDYQDKRWSYEESLRAPLVIRYPKEIPAQHVEYAMMANIDLAPTLLDYAGIPVPAAMQGESCRNVIRGEHDGFVRESVYFRYWMHRAHRHDNPSHYGIRTDKYKLLFYYGLHLDATIDPVGLASEATPAGWELYDMVNDIGERKNLYGDPAYADVVAEMKVLLDQAKVQYQDEDSAYPELMAVRAANP